MRKNVQSRDCLRPLRVTSGREQVEERVDEFLQNLGLLGAVDNDQQRSLDRLP